MQQPSIVLQGTTALRADQIARYHEDGVLSLGQFLSTEECVAIRDRMQLFVTSVVPKLPLHVSEKIVKFEPGTKTVRRLYNLRQADVWFEQLGRSPRLISIARQLVDYDPQLYAVEMFFLQPKIGSGAHIHQEAAYFADAARDRSLNFWVALDDVPEERGAMRFWLGSHKAGLLPSESDVLGNRVVKRDIADAAGRGIKTFPALRGYASVHDGYTVHESLPNRSQHPRMALIVQFRDALRD